jgi:hypothetical protein
VASAGKFIFAGAIYYGRQESVETGRWEGIPVATLEHENASNTPFNNNDDISQIGKEMDMIITKTKHAQLKAGGSLDGLLHRFKGQRSK